MIMISNTDIALVYSIDVNGVYYKKRTVFKATLSSPVSRFQKLICVITVQMSSRPVANFEICKSDTSTITWSNLLFESFVIFHDEVLYTIK